MVLELSILLQGRRAVHFAIERGINFFDVSPYYGLTLAESRLGEALAGNRDKIVLATKCGRYGPDRFDFSERRVAASEAQPAGASCSEKTDGSDQEGRVL